MYFYGAGAAHLIEQLQLPESHIAPFTVSEASAADLRDEENSKRNIIGFGYGEKLVGGAPQGVLAICMYVVRKATPEHIHPKYLAEYLVERFDKGVPPTMPRSWYFYYGRARLYRRLYACAKVLAVIAGALGIVYLNRPETSPMRPTRPLSGCNCFRAVTLRALQAGLRCVREGVRKSPPILAIGGARVSADLRNAVRLYGKVKLAVHTTG